MRLSWKQWGAALAVLVVLGCGGGGGGGHTYQNPGLDAYTGFKGSITFIEMRDRTNNGEEVTGILTKLWGFPGGPAYVGPGMPKAMVYQDDPMDADLIVHPDVHWIDFGFDPTAAKLVYVWDEKDPAHHDDPDYIFRVSEGDKVRIPDPGRNGAYMASVAILRKNDGSDNFGICTEHTPIEVCDPLPQGKLASSSPLPIIGRSPHVPEEGLARPTSEDIKRWQRLKTDSSGHVITE